MAKTILVVEDNELNLQLMVALLGHYGYEVLEARNGAQAVLIARRQPIDLILMDMQMPIMSGYEAVKLLRSEEKIAGIKIIAVTSFALSEEKDKILATGVDGFIAKPIDTREFPRVIQQLLESNPSVQGE
jgi:two-component system cell cycle response regulator DivK